MFKPGAVFLFFAYALPAAVMVGYLVIAKIVFSTASFEVDATIFIASMASGAACFYRGTRHQILQNRIGYLCLYLITYTPILLAFCVTMSMEMPEGRDQA